MGRLRFGEQPELELMDQVEEPWGGMSPRHLTRGANLFRFEARAGDMSCPTLLELLGIDEPLKGKGPEGAPSLVAVRVIEPVPVYYSRRGEYRG